MKGFWVISPSLPWKLAFPLSIPTGGGSAWLRNPSPKLHPDWLVDGGSWISLWQEAEPGLGAPSLGLEFFLGSFTSPFGFPPKMFKPSLSHLRLKDAIGYEGPDVSERRLPEATGDASQ